MKLTAAALCLSATVLAHGAMLEAQDTTLAASLRDTIAASGATVGLYYANLNRPDSVTLDADLMFHAASTMKVAVMVQVFRDIDAGRLSLHQRLPVVNSFHSLVGDSVYQLDPGDDSDSSLYRKVGSTVAVQDLVDLMITRSSNLAANVLIGQVGADRVQATLRELGIDSMFVRRGVEDDAAYGAGLNNTTTARALGQLFSAIANGQAARSASCGAMLRILLHQHASDAIPAGLPHDTKVAHKTGSITALLHDAGVVYVNDRPQYVLVVLTRGIQDQARAARLIANLTRVIHSRLFPPPAPAQAHFR